MSGLAGAVHVDELFEIDSPAADAIADPNVEGDDWDQIYYWETNPNPDPNVYPEPAAIKSLFVTDGSGRTDDIFKTGGSKDVQDVSEWQLDTGNVPDKDDILHAYAAAYSEAEEGNGEEHLIVYFGADRLANNGDAQIGFWFLQDEVAPTATGLSGEHKIGDVLILANFTGGGDITNIGLFKWAGADGIDGYPEFVAGGTQEGGYQVCLEDDTACVATNAGGQESPWPYTPKFGDPGFFPELSFFEGGIDLTYYLGEVGCYSTFLAETRTSQSITAQLKDYALGEFDLCDMEIEKEGDPLSKVGDDVNYDITITNTGAITLYKQSIVDSLLGDLTSQCPSSLAPEEFCNISYPYTVQSGDSDPLLNTVTAVYDSSSSLLGDEVSRTDSHTVNLFQPSITFAKSSDVSLTKVGHDVVYTITLGNTSSPDTPLMECEIDDVMLGVDKSVTLASGSSDVTTVTYTVMAGDPDPLVNTANVLCSPVGFGNEYPASATVSVNLFQPSISAAKTGDELGKIGDPVDYTITLTNSSSADTPAMACTAVDSLLGTVFDGVLPLGDTVIDLTRVVQSGDPDPLVNEVTLTCSPEGWGNTYTATASHSTNLFQPAVEVMKSGPISAARGETITYSFTITNLSSSDSPSLILDSVSDTVLGDLTTVASLAGCDSLGYLGTCSFTYDYTIPATGPNPIVNVVTVHYHPFGFPNDITDFDDHTVLIPNQGCTPGFWQGGSGSALWNDYPDPDWGYVGDQPFEHDTLFNVYFGLNTDSRLDGKTMFDLVSTGGTSDSAQRAARDMVAAYLNESAFPADFPASSLEGLEEMWYEAVAGGDAALDAFHGMVSGWNDPGYPNACPLP